MHRNLSLLYPLTLAVGLSLSLLPCPVPAQEAAAPPSQSADAPQKSPGGIVFGHVTFGDTNTPARFTNVLLKPVTPPNPQDDFLTVLLDSALQNMQEKTSSDPNSTQPDLASARNATTRLLGDIGDSLNAATVDANGDFTFTGVPSGSYYIHVRAPGYIDPLASFSEDDLESPNPAVRKKIAAAVAVVKVEDGQVVRADLALERGASISGRLRYDDGSPAAGWTLRAIPPATPASRPLTELLGFDLTPLDPVAKLQSTITDDTGLFRIAGLPSGDFVLEGRLTQAALDHSPFDPVASAAGSFLSILGGMSSMASMRLVVYSGDVARLSAAKAIHVRAGEDHTTADIQVRLHSMHTLSGYVVSKLDGHSINSGNVELSAQDDQGNSDPTFHRIASIHPDGTFRFDYIPAATTYKLQSLQGADTSTVSTMRILGSLIAGHKTNNTYLPASTSVILSDHDITGIRIEVAPSTQ